MPNGSRTRAHRPIAMSNGRCTASPPALRKAAKASSTSSTRTSVSGPMFRCATSSASVSGRAKPTASSLLHKNSMPEAIAIKGYRQLKIGDTKQKVVELSKQGPVGAHVAKHPRLKGVLAIREPDHLFAAARIGPAPFACTIAASARAGRRRVPGRSPLRPAICPAGPFRAPRPCKAKCGRRSRRAGSSLRPCAEYSARAIRPPRRPAPPPSPPSPPRRKSQRSGRPRRDRRG